MLVINVSTIHQGVGPPLSVPDDHPVEKDVPALFDEHHAPVFIVAVQDAPSCYADIGSAVGTYSAINHSSGSNVNSFIVLQLNVSRAMDAWSEVSYTRTVLRRFFS